MATKKPRRTQLTPRSERQAWTYFVSRDSTCGVVGDKCALWGEKPKRKRQGVHIIWDGEDFIGEYSPGIVRHWSRVVPDTDLELLRCETYATESQLKELAKK